MSDNKSGRTPAWAIALLVLCSCAEVKPQRPVRASPPSPDQRYFSFTTEQLVSYGGELARLGIVDRLAECTKVLGLYRANQQTAVLLHLFIAELASEACGDPVKIRALVRALSPTIKDERLRNYLAFQGLLADHVIAGSAERERVAKKLKEVQWRLKQAQNKATQAQTKEKKAKTKGKEIYEKMISRDAEAKALKQKLDALKSIEQDLNEDTERHDTND